MIDRLFAHIEQSNHSSCELHICAKTLMFEFAGTDWDPRPFELNSSDNVDDVTVHRATQICLPIHGYKHRSTLPKFGSNSPTPGKIWAPGLLLTIINHYCSLFMYGKATRMW